MYVIEAGLMIDGTGEEPIPGCSVMVKEGRIFQIEKTTHFQLPEDIEVIDAHHLTLMPGMIDCHTHLHFPGGPDINNSYSMLALTESQSYLTILSIDNIQKDLRMGFTTLRVLGTPFYIDVAIRRAIEEGLVIGPRLKVAGQGICVTGGHMDKADWSPDVFVNGRTGVGDGPWGCRVAAREQLKYGADLLKINACGGSYNLNEPWHQEMTYEEMAAVIEEAHWAGKRVAAHAHGGKGITDAILAGLDSIEHGLWLTEEQAKMMAEHNVYYVPTLSTHTRGLELGKVGSGSSEEGWKWLVKACEDRWVSLERAKKAGVKVCLGTDAGFWMYHGENALELEEFVRAGYTPMEAIKAATILGAENLDIANITGSISVGKYADLILVDGNPLEDIKILQKPNNIVQVYKEGRPIK